MKIHTTHVAFGRVPVRRLEWSARERELLVRTIELLGRARERVGEEADEGMELGKAETVLRDYIDGVTLEVLT